jgi:ribosomal protein S18 acetylase RimI-like enzyme
VDVVSLGFRTDLMLRRFAGASIVDRGGYVVVRTPANPTFYWGNFLLFPGPPPPGAAAGWLATFAEEIPSAGHRAIGVDGTDGDVGDQAEIEGLGLTVEVNTVLTATALRAPAHRPAAGAGPPQAAGAAEAAGAAGAAEVAGVAGAAEVACRQLSGDADWAQADALAFACDDRSDEPGHREFLAGSQRAARALCEACHGTWFGAFVDGQMRSGCGIFTDGAGVARFQNVETDPGYRRRGLASQVVYQAGHHALAELGAATLVIVADPDYPAIGIYRSLGFADSERQVQLQREPLGP